MQIRARQVRCKLLYFSEIIFVREVIYYTRSTVCGQNLVDAFMSHLNVLGLTSHPRHRSPSSNFNVLERLSTRFCSVTVGICQFGQKAFVRSGTDVGRESLEHSQCWSWSQMSVLALRSRLCVGHLSSFNPTLSNPCIYGPCFVHSGIAMLEQFRVRFSEGKL